MCVQGCAAAEYLIPAVKGFRFHLPPCTATAVATSPTLLRAPTYTPQVGDLTFIFPPPPSSAATLVMGYRMLSQLSTSPAPSSAVESQRMVEVLKAGGNKGQGVGGTRICCKAASKAGCDW